MRYLSLLSPFLGSPNERCLCNIHLLSAVVGNSIAPFASRPCGPCRRGTSAGRGLHSRHSTSRVGTLSLHVRGLPRIAQASPQDATQAWQWQLPICSACWARLVRGGSTVVTDADCCRAVTGGMHSCVTSQQPLGAAGLLSCGRVAVVLMRRRLPPQSRCKPMLTMQLCRMQLQTNVQNAAVQFAALQIVAFQNAAANKMFSCRPHRWCRLVCVCVYQPANDGEGVAALQVLLLVLKARLRLEES
jgi:hypothetical protein